MFVLKQMKVKKFSTVLARMKYGDFICKRNHGRS